MSECMTQEDAMNMNAEQAIQILKPMQMMMRDQNGCPISDAYFALEKAIEALEQKADAVERKHGEWNYDIAYYDEDGCPCIVFRCSECGEAYPKSNFCPNCGADMRGENDG